MRQCYCGTILNSHNTTGLCSIHQQPPMRNDSLLGYDTPFSEDQRHWARLLYKIRVEIARAFGTTVVDLENPGCTQSHLAVELILVLFLRLPVRMVMRYMHLNCAAIEIRKETTVLYQSSREFRERCQRVSEAMRTTDIEIEPFRVNFGSISGEEDDTGMGDHRVPAIPKGRSQGFSSEGSLF